MEWDPPSSLAASTARRSQIRSSRTVLSAIGVDPYAEPVRSVTWHGGVTFSGLASHVKSALHLDEAQDERGVGSGHSCWVPRQAWGLRDQQSQRGFTLPSWLPVSDMWGRGCLGVSGSQPSYALESPESVQTGRRCLQTDECPHALSHASKLKYGSHGIESRP